MIRTTTTLLLAIVLLASCNQYKKTPSGVAYKITRGSGSEKLKNGQFLKYNIEYRIPPKDSIFNTSFGHIPGYLVIDTANKSKHSFLEFLSECSVGDKIDFVLSVDTLKKLGMLEYNALFHQGDMIKGRVELLAEFKTQVDAQADVQKEVDNEKQRELKELKDYSARVGAKNTVTTRSGAFVEVLNAGDPVAKADSGKMAKVMYKGVFSKNGLPFDTNMDPKGTHTAPLEILVGSVGGQNSVIPGLDEGIRLFGKGGKGRIFIPAMAAYGDKGQPPVIPGYANMVFDVEVIDVTTPPPPAPTPGPGMPPMPKR